MAFTDVKYYRNYCGDSYEPPYPDELDSILERASEIADTLTGGRISAAGGAEGFPPAIADKVLRAVCAEAAYIERNGGLSYLDSSTPVQMSLGRFSYMHASGAVERKTFPVSPIAVRHLEQAGLLARQLAVEN